MTALALPTYYTYADSRIFSPRLTRCQVLENISSLRSRPCNPNSYNAQASQSFDSRVVDPVLENLTGLLNWLIEQYLVIVLSYLTGGISSLVSQMGYQFWYSLSAGCCFTANRQSGEPVSSGLLSLISYVLRPCLPSMDSPLERCAPCLKRKLSPCWVNLGILLRSVNFCIGLRLYHWNWMTLSRTSVPNSMHFSPGQAPVWAPISDDERLVSCMSQLLTQLDSVSSAICALILLHRDEILEASTQLKKVNLESRRLW